MPLLGNLTKYKSNPPQWFLEELMLHVQKLSSVLELTVDCSGMTTSKMVKTVRHAAKCFLSGIHGRERLQMRCGSAVRKAGVAVVGAIDNQMQKRTRHEMYRHQRNMEQVRLAGRMRRYINSALMRNSAMGLSPNLTVSVPVLELRMQVAHRSLMHREIV